jgi:tetratricopeptide (TPR) repeat protein
VNTVDRDGLEAEREFLLRSIADLDAEAAVGDLDPTDHQALRDDYVARAAAVVRALEQAPTLSGSLDLPVAATRSVSRGRGVVVVVACLALAGVAGVALARSSGSRPQGAPLTGSLPSSNAAELEQAANFVAQGKAVEAVKLYDKVLKNDPKQPVALAYRGWLVRLAGLKDEGLAYVDRAVSADPSYADAHFFRGMMLWEDKKDPASAVAEFRLFLADNPPQQMVSLVQDALQRAAAEAGIPAG